MKRTYILKGLDCPHCASQIENGVSKLNGVDSVNVNLMKQSLEITCDKCDDKTDKAVRKIVHKFEPDVVVTVRESEKHHDHEGHEHHHKCCEHDHDHHDHEGHEHHHKCCEHDHDHHDHEGHEHHHHNKQKSAENAAATVIFTLDGLDCPHCASEIEQELERVHGVAAAEINLLNGQLKVFLTDEFDGDILLHVKKAVKLHEPDVEVYEGDKEHKHEDKATKSFSNIIKSDEAVIFRFAAGIVLYAAGLILSHFANAPLFMYLPILIAAYLILGIDVVLGAAKNILSGRIFDEKFLMTVSTVGAFAIGEYPEAVAVMLFYQIGEFFQTLAVKRSRRSISELMDFRPDSANVLRNGEMSVVAPSSVNVGDTIIVKAGERVPLDGVVISGKSMLDTRALTGESVPRSVKEGDDVLSGCINESGAITVRVTKLFGESTASKILDLVENAAGRKAPTENFISVFARYYTPVVVGLAVLLGVLPPLILGGGWSEWIRRCFVFLVISCPCALVISIPLTFFGGIGAASRRGVLVKGTNYLEALNYVDTVVFDKTGTLTKGTFSVTKLYPEKGVSEEKLLQCAAAVEQLSNHPIARSIIAEYKGELPKSESYREISGHGISAVINEKNVMAGNLPLMKENGVDCTESSDFGTVVYVSENGRYLGSIVISDEVKETSSDAITALKSAGIGKTVMLTGDRKGAAEDAAKKLGIDEFHSELLPTQKVEQLEKLYGELKDGAKLAFVGDGINDAPVLARADVGIAMGALGSDAAIEAADIVLMNDDPLSLVDAVKTARFTKRIVTQNIVLVLAVKVIILTLGALGIASMWLAVFGDVGVMILAVLNSMRILLKKK